MPKSARKNNNNHSSSTYIPAGSIAVALPFAYAAFITAFVEGHGENDGSPRPSHLVAAP